MSPGSVYRIALAPRAGQKVLSVRTVAGRDETNTTVLCADAHGVAWEERGASRGSLLRHHARKRSRIALRCIRATRLCRAITGRAIANERLKRDGSGDVVLQLKSAWRDGTTHIRMSPLEFMRRIAA